MGLQLPHLIILLVIIVLLFGAGRVSNIMGELGKGIKSFKQGVSDEEEERRKRAQEQRHLPPQGRAPEQPIDVTPEPRSTTEAPRNDDQPNG